MRPSLTRGPCRVPLSPEGRSLVESMSSVEASPELVEALSYERDSTGRGPLAREGLDKQPSLERASSRPSRKRGTQRGPLLERSSTRPPRKRGTHRGPLVEKDSSRRAPLVREGLIEERPSRREGLDGVSRRGSRRALRAPSLLQRGSHRALVGAPLSQRGTRRGPLAELSSRGPPGEAGTGPARGRRQGLGR